jgi:hypothetical protein
MIRVGALSLTLPPELAGEARAIGRLLARELGLQAGGETLVLDRLVLPAQSLPAGLGAAGIARELARAVLAEGRRQSGANARGRVGAA